MDAYWHLRKKNAGGQVPAFIPTPIWGRLLGGALCI